MTLDLTKRYIPYLLRRFRLGPLSLGRDCVGDLICYPGSSSTSSEYHHAHVFHLHGADMQGCHHSSQRDTARPLDIVIEARDLRLILIQYSLRIMETKIFTVIVCER